MLDVSLGPAEDLDLRTPLPDVEDRSAALPSVDGGRDPALRFVMLDFEFDRESARDECPTLWRRSVDAGVPVCRTAGIVRRCSFLCIDTVIEPAKEDGGRDELGLASMAVELVADDGGAASSWVKLVSRSLSRTPEAASSKSAASGLLAESRLPRAA
jgi:hypothetical protein